MRKTAIFLCLALMVLFSAPGGVFAKTCFTATGTDALLQCARLIADPKTRSVLRLRALEKRASTYLSLHRYSKAIDDADRIIAQKPKSQAALRVKAKALSALSGTDAAFADIRAQLKRDIYDQHAFENLAHMLMRQARFADLARDATAFLEGFPRSYKGLFYRGYAHYALGEMRLALTDFEKSLEGAAMLNDDMTDLLNCRGLARLFLGQWTFAANEHAMAFRVAANAGKAQGGLCGAYLHAAPLFSARAYFTR
jgi:tetratricopeptide (TPR) repeat protein